MTTCRSTFFALGVILALVAPVRGAETAPPPATAASADLLEVRLSDADWAKLRSGGIVLNDRIVHDAEGKAHGAGVAFALVHAPTDAIWSTILDFDRYSEYFPRVTTCVRTLWDGHEVDASFRLRILIVNIDYSIRHFYEGGRGRMSWVLDPRKKNDIKGSTGFWEIHPEGKDGSLVEYSVTVDSGWLVPEKVEEFLAKKDLPSVVEALRKRVESGNTWTRDGGEPEARASSRKKSGGF